MFSQVKVGDEIKVSGVTEYIVTGIVSDSELQARRAGKGPETIGAIEAAKLRLGPEDSNDFRVLETTSASFIAAGGFGQNGTKVRSGDVIRVDNWAVKEGSGGLIFDAVGENAGTTINARTLTADDRLLTLPATSGITVAPYTTTTAEGTVFFVANDLDELVPAFYAIDSAALEVAAGMFESNIVDDSQDADNGASYRAISYSAPAATGADGSFTALSSGTRTFTGTGFNAAGALNATNQIHVAIKGQDGIFRPVFNVTAVGGDTELTVEPLDSTELAPTAIANNVEYAIVTFDSTAATEAEIGGGATVTADASEGAIAIDAIDFLDGIGGSAKTTVDAGERLLAATDATLDFSTDSALP